MEKAKLVLANFDARISKIEIKPKNNRTKVVISSRMFDNEPVKLVFEGVAAIDFRINYFDNMIGAEVLGLYEITDQSFIDRVVKDTFERRKEIYLLEGDYDYEEDDENDMLNVLDLGGDFSGEKELYHAYVQNVDAGVYIIVAKQLRIVRKNEM